MNPTPQTAPTRREDIRSQLHEHVDALFHRLFPADPTVPLPAFERIEELTLQLTRDLDSWLLEQRVQSSDAVRPTETPGCPKCQQPAVRVGDGGDPLPSRVLKTRAGPIELAREQWRCTACRVVFFPPR